MKPDSSRNKSIWCGDLVMLRAKTMDDIPIYLADGVVDDMRLYGDGFVPYPVSEEDRRKRLESDTNQDHGEACSLAIATHEGDLVGSINSVDCDPRVGSFWYGVAIFDAYRRRGFALDAVRILLRYYFEERRYHRAGAKVYSFNEASIRLQEQLGFQLEGRQREIVFTQGARHDLLLYGMTRAEFDTHESTRSEASR